MSKYLHVSSPINRGSILKTGLLPSQGIRRCFGNELLAPAVFLSKMEAFNTTFDDDLYEVEIKKENRLFVDKAMPDAFYLFEKIPSIRLKLIYEGTGKDLL